MNIYLIGYRCTGKTSCGKVLSLMTGRTFMDTDELFVSDEKNGILNFIEKSGWKEFRSKETKILKELSIKDQLIVSTGGGIVIDKENVRIMKNTGKIIWLYSDPETIFRRFKKDPASLTNRPQLTGMPLFEEINMTLRQRTYLYASSADITVKTDEMSILDVCHSVLDQLNQHETSR